MSVIKLKVFVNINGLIDDKGNQTEKLLRMQFNENQITIQYLIDQISEKVDLFEKYKLISVNTFDSDENQNVELINFNEFVVDLEKFTMNVCLKNPIKQVCLIY